MVSVAFVVHPDRPQADELAARGGEWLRSRGHSVATVMSDSDHAHEEGETTVMAKPLAVPADLLERPIDLAVSLGGDGTMLRTVAATVTRGIPVLGVNLGQLGYLTEVDPAALETALERFVNGDYRIEERMTLSVRVERSGARASASAPNGGDASGTARAAGDTGTGSGHEDGSYIVLNEAVVEKTVPGHTIRVAAAVDGKPFVIYAADGLLVATPTGSTAYNLSARGPIVSPQLRAMVVTPISPHMLFDRALVLAPDESLRLELAEPRPALVVLDGQHVATLDPGDAIVCGPGEVPARLVTFGGRDFHAILRARFHLADR